MTNPYKSPKMTKESLIAPRARATIFERLMSHAKVNGECLEYVGNNDHNGYGRIKANGRQLGAHRVAYVEFIGDIDAGMVVMHSCDNPACINPNHLSLGTVKQNIHDCINKGRFCHNGRRKWSQRFILRAITLNLFVFIMKWRVGYIEILWLL